MQPSVPPAYQPNMQNYEHNRPPSSNQQYVYSTAPADPRGTHGPLNPNYPNSGASYSAANVSSPVGGALPPNQMRSGPSGSNDYHPYQPNVAQVSPQPGQPALPPQPVYGNQHNVQSNSGHPSTNTASYNNLPSAQYRNADTSSAYTSALQGSATVNGYNTASLTNQMNRMTVTNQGFNKLWGTDHVNLLEQKNIIPPYGRKPPEITFHQDYMTTMNCNPEIFRCTLTRIPESKALLNKSRLPLGILIHPFKDLTQLPVIQCSTIVRCRSCRTYINPYVYFVDSRRWKCNLCSRVNDLPEEFQYDPVSKTYGDPSRRPEVRSATIEFLAPADYMVRPPQAAIYLYLLDISATAVDTGYLKQVCSILLENMDQIPGDSRAQIGFIAFDSSVHFFSLAENLSQPHEMVVCDIDDIFIPCPDDLLVSITNNRQMIENFISLLPTRYKDTADNGSALGAAMLAAQKLLAPVGGRITVLQCSLPSLGPGKLVSREVTGKTAVKELKAAVNPSTDFYKKLALDCSSQFIAVDIFFLGNSYMDIASISCASKFSGGSNYYFPNYRYMENSPETVLFEQSFHRYVTRKIGFEAVMRVRCSRGLSIHTFHGNFFVRSTDLLSLPNCNPDAGFGMQVSIDENLVESQQVCFQAALLYTSSKGERRIRVHTLCLPVVGNINDVLGGADQECIMGLVAKMAVDKSLDSGIGDAREAFLNVVTDVLSSYRATQNIGTSYSLIAPHSLKLLPLFTHAILRSPGFRTDTSIRLDVRVHFLNQLKTLPLFSLIQLIYPDLYPVHDIFSTPLVPDTEDEIPNFAVTHLSASQIEARGVYVLDKPDCLWVYVGRSVSRDFLVNIFNVPSFETLQPLVELPQLDNVFSKRLQNFVNSIQMTKPHYVPLKIMREDSKDRLPFFQNLVEDRSDSGTSYYEFLQQIKTSIT